ncbi:MAG: branched-chain amino acid transaminase [Lachnospiraceae bacterium]|nr:branched-chain amino acid transaminase [Lachnospiraceae bacterium]
MAENISDRMEISMKTSIDERYIWLDGQIVNVNDAKINVLSPTSQFAVNVFEGIRCYWNEENNQLYAFRLDDHYNRLAKSRKLLRIAEKYNDTQLKQAFIDVIRANEYKEDIAVRQTIFIDGFGSWSSTDSVNMFVAPIPKGKLSTEYNRKGLNCCISSWRRIDENSLSPRIKCGANYINSRMAQLEAINNGYDTAIFLNSSGNVAEAPGSCLFIVKDGKLITPSLTEGVLESITRDTVIHIAKDILKIEVEERVVNRTELYTCDEAFLCGSAMEITPVYSVDHYNISNNSYGEISKRIHELYLEIVTGKYVFRKEWLTEVYE